MLCNEVLRSAEAARWLAACGPVGAAGSPQRGPSWPERYVRISTFVVDAVRVCKRRQLARGAACSKTEASAGCRAGPDGQRTCRFSHTRAISGDVDVSRVQQNLPDACRRVCRRRRFKNDHA